MRREPTWAYRYDRDKSSQQELNSPLQESLSSPALVGSSAASQPLLYRSISTQSSLNRNQNNNTSFINKYEGGPAYENEEKNDPQPSPVFGSDFSDRNITTSRSSNPKNSISETFRYLVKGERQNLTIGGLSKAIACIVLLSSIVAFYFFQDPSQDATVANAEGENDFRRPSFVYEHPYVSSSYYSATTSEKTLIASEKRMQEQKLMAASGKGRRMSPKTRLAIVRPFCEFDAAALPSTFACWDALVPCKTAFNDLGDQEGITNGEQNRSSWNTLADASADLFLFYSQTFEDNPVALGAVDAIINTYNEPGGWSQCFDNIYAIEANIPRDLDLYIPSAQEELYNWVNGPNRQFEAAFRIIQSGEWGDYDGFYLMEGDSIPVKSHWMDHILHSIETHRPFAILGAKYNGDKWDNFYESIPLSLLHHINGNAIYNTSHPLLERLVGQLEIEAPCPYNSIPYDYRMSQMVTEGALKIVPKLAPKIMLNEEGENITLSDNTEMFSRWWDMYKAENPFKETYVIHNYAATNLIPRHLGPEYIIHGAKLYSPWDPTKTEVTLVISEWFYDRSHHLLSHLDRADHPFSKVIVMIPPDVMAHEEYNMTVVPVVAHHRTSPDHMDLCEAPVETEYFMLTNSYHHTATHVDLMFTPGTFKPVTAFTPATYPFCFKFPYCKETVNLAQRFHPGHKKVVQDFDMLYKTEYRNAFCDEWKERWGFEGEDLYKNQKQRLLVRGNIIGPKGPTGTAYTAYLIREGLEDSYKFTDRSLYGARDAFIKIFAKEEKLDGMTDEERAKRVGVTGFDNSTDCDCKAFETQAECENSPLGCVWRPLFDSCRPPEMIDDGTPICPQTDAPTMSPTVFYEFDDTMGPTASPTRSEGEADPWYASLFKAREHDETPELEEEGTYVLTREDEGDTDVIGELTDIDLESNSTEESAGSEGNDSGRKLTEDISGRRKLNLLSFDSESVLPVSYSSPSTSPILEHQKELFTSSESEYDLNNNISRELYLTSPDSRSQQTNFYLAPTTSPANAMESCPTWGPSIVKRTESKKRKKSPFHNNFLEERVPVKKILSSASDLYFKSSDGSTILPSTESEFSRDERIERTGLRIPDIKYTKNVPLDKKYIRITNYRDRHPFEGGGSGLLDGYGTSDPFEKMRIKFETTHLENILSSDNSDKSTEKQPSRVARADAMIREILPSVSGIYSEALQVIPVFGNLFPASSTCGSAALPSTHVEDGVPNSDLVIYVTVSNDLCSTQKTQVTVCNFDQHMRPIVGNLEICLDSIPVDQDQKVSKEEMLHQITYFTLEIGKILGLSPGLFQFFRNPDTGRPWGASPQSVTCVDGTEKTLDLPNILNAGISRYDSKKPVYEVISPTVLQVVRNHFDCQTMSGADLDSTDSSESCYGSYWDKRLFFDEDWTTGTTRRGHKSFSLSPLTLALLEDSSWYKADYRKATISSFGHGAGCGFVEGNCNIKGELPSHSKGFFCNSIPADEPTGCDYTHGMKASCDSHERKETDFPFQQALIPDLSQTDTMSCPMMSKNLISCASTTNTPVNDFEFYGRNSKCFETNSNTSFCLAASCNKKDRKVEFMISEEIYQCDYDGQVIKIDDDLSILCPRIAAVCPDLICPSSCSGRGICDFCLEAPQCICDDPFDNSPGCWGTQ